jgi:hypothetical protein
VKLNADWHRAHPMPKNPTLDQRVAWHLEHAKTCGCRELPKSVVEALKSQRAKSAAKPRR